MTALGSRPTIKFNPLWLARLGAGLIFETRSVSYLSVNLSCCIFLRFVWLLVFPVLIQLAPKFL